jgi:hypothetical protein
MRSHIIGIPSRVAFFACGVISIALSRVYLALVGSAALLHGSWYPFSAVLMAVGGVAILIALVPGSWVAQAFKVDRERRSLLPLKAMGAFAGAAYVIIAAVSVALHSSSPSPQLVFSVCPACVLTILVDPSLSTVLLFLAPLSAAVYGAVGGELGYLSVVLHKNR